jgi:hypothetical protein
VAALTTEVGIGSAAVEFRVPAAHIIVPAASEA